MIRFLINKVFHRSSWMLLCLGFLPALVFAKDWHSSLSINAVGGQYGSNSLKDSQFSSEITLNTAYLEQSGYGLSLQYLNSPYSAGSQLEQYKIRGSYWRLLTPDHLAYKIIPSVDFYFIDNNDHFGGSDKVATASLSAAFIALNKSHSLTPSLSYSSYNGQFSVLQFDFAAGFSYNDQWANLTYKPSVIKVSDKNASTKRWYFSHKITSTHYIKQPEKLFQMSAISASLSAGDKAFGVDVEQKALYNLSDVSQYALSLNLTFDVKEKSQWLLGAGYESFKTVKTDSTYGLLYGYVQYVKSW